MKDRLNAVVFEWRGDWHAYVERVAPAPDHRVPRRTRLMSQSWRRSSGVTDEQEAIRALIGTLESVLTRLEAPPPPGGFGAP